MTAEDLKELGISSFGHRRRLFNAITALGGEPPTRDVAQSATSATSAPTAPPPIDAERRQLTVMFCDLVGSTALSTRLDPEDLREVIGAYHRAVAETVGRFDGFVAKYMGDGVLVYFGYPQAHEDDAERAVRAGLAVIEAVGRLPAPAGSAGAGRHRHRAGRGRRSDRRGRGAGARRSSARRRTSPPGCRRWPSRTRSSSPRARAGWSAICSSTRDLGAASACKGFAEPQCGLAGAAARAASRAGSRRCASGADAARRPRRGNRPAAAPLGSRRRAATARSC